MEEHFSDFVERFRERYHTRLKPLLEKEEGYKPAKEYLEEIMTLIQVDREMFNLRETTVVNSGVSLVGAIERVYKKLNEGKFDYTNGDLKELETCLEKTKLTFPRRAESIAGIFSI